MALAAIVRFHANLFGFFINDFMGRIIYTLLVVLYFTKPFHFLIDSAITFALGYLLVTGSLLFISLNVPLTREWVFQAFGKDKEYLYKRLGNPRAHSLGQLLGATVALAFTLK